MKTKQIIEGKTKLIVPEKKAKWPESVFYNPEMEKSRTLSIEIVDMFFHGSKRKIKILDLLSGTGARAVRYANELVVPCEVYANDVQPSAVRMIEENAKLNKVQDKMKISANDANEFLYRNAGCFDCIDIDPFGSPIPFTSNAIRALNPERGVICATATDVGASCGVFKEACLRKYGTSAARTSFSYELGLRNLLFALSQQADAAGRSIAPIYVYYSRHYMRIFVEILPGKNKSIPRGSEGFIKYCSKCERREIISAPQDAGAGAKCLCGGTAKILGPTWISVLCSEKFAYLDPSLRIAIPYYDLSALGRALKKQNKPIDEIIKSLRSAGFAVCRTKMAKQGIKTDAPYETVINAVFDSAAKK
ncbi:MAG: 50S ribosomal protein L11 methyltransferase [Candidatus Micrarchaeota archaeon]